MNRLKEKIIQCFNKGAATYDQAADVQVIAARRLCEQLQQTTPTSILEIGCGTGLLTHYLVEQFPSAKIVMTDISPQMIAVASARFKQNEHIRAMCVDGETLVLKEHYDLIVSNMVLHWFTDFKWSLKKIIHQLNPNAQFRFALLGSHSLHEWRALCANNKITIGKSHFPSRQDIVDVCPEIKLEVETVTHHYSSLYNFLKTLKRLGASATEMHYIPLSIKQLRHLLKHGEAAFSLSYEIIYGTFVKP